jgi:peptide deformylase
LVAEKFDVVDFKDPELSLCLMDLLDTMRKHNLVGLSAPQIGINKNIFITGIRKSINSDTEDFDSLRIFINPEISSFSREEVEMMESCGSVEHSDLFAPVLRSKTVIVKAL